MGNYCKHHTTIGGMFSGNTVITDITIPPSCGERILLFVIQTVMKTGGKIWENPAFGMDGSILLTPITFQSNDAREKCCEEIEKTIEKVLENQKPISINPVEGEEDNFEVRLNIKFLFLQFQDIMKKISPAIEFVENHGGWFDGETGQFPGFDALEKARADGTLDEEQAKEIDTALLTFGNFMGAYILGSHLIGDENTTIVPHEE